MGSLIGDFTPKAMPHRDANAAVIDMDFNGLNAVVRLNSNRLSQLSSVVAVLSATSGGSAVSGANPSASIGLSAVNGIATTFLRSDGAPALSQAIAPTWTGIHTWSAASDVTQVIHKGFAGQTAALTKWTTSASALLASVAISGRYYTANHLEVLDTFGVVSSMAPETPPSHCLTGLTYIYDAPTYNNTTLWTNSNDTIGVSGSPLEYAPLTMLTGLGGASKVATITSTSTLWTDASFDYRIWISGRGAYSGTLSFFSGVTRGAISVLYQLSTSAGNVILAQKVTDHTGATTTTNTTLGPISGSYSVTRVIRFTRPTSASGTISISVDGVSVLASDVTGVGGSTNFIVDCNFQILGDYDGGATNSEKNGTTLRNIQIVGDSMATSCDIGANTDRKLLTRQGTEIQIGEAASWTAMRSKINTGGTFEWLAGATSLATWTPAQIAFSANVLHSGKFQQTGTMSIGPGGANDTYVLGISGAVTGWTYNNASAIACFPTFPTTATTAGNNIYVKSILAIGAWTMTLGRGIFIDTPFLGSGSAVTTYAALDIATQTQGGTAYAIRTGLQGLIQFGKLTASQAVFTDGSKNLVSNAITGTGSVVMSASPALTGTVTAVAMTMSGLLLTVASATGSAGFRLPHGAAPTAPTNGDVWTTTAGMFVRVNGVTVGPLT